MSTKSKIEWTDTTWNPVRGCTKISPGCKNCYAETFAERWRGIKGHPYEHGFDLKLVPEKLDEPLRWRNPSRVFVNSMSDLFQEGVPFEYIDKVFAVMALASKHTFQILTKRPDRMREYCIERARKMTAQRAEECPSLHNAYPDFLPNVWLGVSVENQKYADERIPPLLQTPAAVRFISYEPAIGPVDFTRINGGTIDALLGHDFESIGDIRDRGDLGKTQHPPALDWIIVGGESGPGARHLDIKWVRDLKIQCDSAGTALFVKQLGAKPVHRCRLCKPGQEMMCQLFKAKRNETGHGADGMVPEYFMSRKGGDMEEWPEDLRGLRAFPKGVTA